MPKSEAEIELDEARIQAKGWLGGRSTAEAVERLIRAVLASEREAKVIVSGAAVDVADLMDGKV